MGNWRKEQEEIRAKKEREKIRKEKLSGFLYNMALATFSVWVLGIALSVYQSSEISSKSICMLLGGFIAVVLMAAAGNNKLK